MKYSSAPKKEYQVGIRPIDRTIERLVRMTGEIRNEDLLNQLLTTVAKIGREKFTRGDLKVLNTTLKELRYAFHIFQPYRQIRKVAIFGSARTGTSAPAYKSARRFSELMVKSGWMVITGGSTGIMRAGHEGATSARSFGLNIRLPFEQEVNPVIKGDRKLIHFKYFFTRKLSFIKESDATVLYPGGFGTHDEGLESLTLSQTGKNAPRPIVLVDSPGGNYWTAWLRFVKKFLLEKGMIDSDDYELMTLVRDPKEACDVLTRFYRVYHSLRYVSECTVIRLNGGISDAKLMQLNRHFSKILMQGKIERTAPLPAEADEPEIASLPRLRMYFDRQNYGTLKRLIDCINEE